MKKILLSLSVVLLCAVLAGCSKEDGPTKEFVGTVWSGAQIESGSEVDYTLTFKSASQATIRITPTAEGSQETMLQMTYAYSKPNFTFKNIENSVTLQGVYTDGKISLAADGGPVLERVDNQ